MEANVETRTIVLADGRELCVEVGGDLSGTPIVVHGGTPNSRHLFGPSIADARARGATLICYDRPGYGRSTPHKGHSVADGAADVCAIAESLGIERLATWGVSGGGPYALACAALLPDLVVAAAAVASIAPWAAPELDYFDGMGELNVEDIHLYFSDPDAARKKGQQECEQYLAATPEQVASAMSTLLSPVDAAALTGDLANWLVWAMQDGLVPGDEGWWDDGVAHLAPWGFDLSAIRVPVKVWHGRQDRFVPVSHGIWLGEHIPGAETDISGEDGHLSLIGRIGEVHAWLLGRF